MKEINNKIIMMSLSDIKAYEGSHNTDDVIEMIKDSLSKFGIQQPIIIDTNNVVVAGNAIYKAAVAIGMSEVPCIVVDELTEEEVAQYRIADNKTGEFARWNERKLKNEMSYLADPNELQFCFDEDIMGMLGMAQPKEEKRPVIVTTPPPSDKKAKPLNIEDVMEDEEPIEDNIEDIEAKKAYNEQLQAQIREKERISKEKAEARFKEQIEGMKKEMEVKPTEYFEYVCGKCGKTVRVKAK